MLSKEKLGEYVISILGIVLIVIILLSIVGLRLNQNIMRFRLVVEEKFTAIEDLLRERLEIFMMLADMLDAKKDSFNKTASEENPRELLEAAADALAADIIKTLPQIIEVQKPFKSRKNEWPTKIREALTENSERLSAAAEAYNNSIMPYNESISRFPGNLMAMLLTIFPEEPFLDSENL